MSLQERAAGVLQSALKRAGRDLMGSFGTKWRVEVKGDASNVVTGGDIAAEKTITRELEKEFPTHGILTEEAGLVHKARRYTWIIDPICGSSNYACSLPFFGCDAALLDGADPIVAGIYLPFYDEYYHATLGGGAYMNDRRIHTTEEAELGKLLIAIGINYRRRELDLRHDLELLGRVNQRAMGIRSSNCVVDKCYVADGRFGGQIGTADKIFDIAAPILVIEEAGGVTTDMKGRKLDLSFTERNYRRRFEFVGAGRKVHSRILGLIRA